MKTPTFAALLGALAIPAVFVDPGIRCLNQGEGFCQFYIEGTFDTGVGFIYPTTWNKVVIYDAACNELTSTDGSFPHSITSPLKYTVEFSWVDEKTSRNGLQFKYADYSNNQNANCNIDYDMSSNQRGSWNKACIQSFPCGQQ